MQTDNTIRQPITSQELTPTMLLQRLDSIGQCLRASNKALALLGLGSVGIETERLDQYSDVDFFAIV